MLSRGLQTIRDTLDHRDHIVGYTEIERAFMGFGDGNGTLIVNGGLPRQVWLHRPSTTEKLIAYLPPNNTIPLRDGDKTIETIEARIGKPPGVDYKVVIDFLSIGGIESSGTLTPMENLIYSGYWTTLDQIGLFRCRASTPVAGLSVQFDVNACLLNPNDNSLAWAQTITILLSSYVSALSAGQHQLILPYYDQASQSAGILTTPAVSSTATVGTTDSHDEFTASSMSGFSGITYAMVTMQPVELYYGQTVVSDSAFYRSLDSRQLFAVLSNPAPSKVWANSNLQEFQGFS